MAFRDQKGIPLVFHMRSQCHWGCRDWGLRRKRMGNYEGHVEGLLDGSRQMQAVHHKLFQQGLLPHWTSTSLLWRHFSVDPDISGSSHSVPEFFISDKCRIVLLFFLWLQTIYGINGASHCIHYLRVGVFFIKKFSFQAFAPHCVTFLCPGKLGDALWCLGLREGNGKMNFIILAVLKVSEKQN